MEIRAGENPDDGGSRRGGHFEHDNGGWLFLTLVALSMQLVPVPATQAFWSDAVGIAVEDSDNHVWIVLEDKNLWKYDGTDLEFLFRGTFPMDTTPVGITVEDDEAHVWSIGADGDLWKRDGMDMQFLARGSFPINPVGVAVEDDESRVWAVDVNGELWRREFDQQFVYKGSFGISPVVGLATEDSDRHAWAVTADGQLRKYDGTMRDVSHLARRHRRGG